MQTSKHYIPKYYTLGLDLGIRSIGWAIVELDYNSATKKFNNKRLINSGTLITTLTQDEKGKSYAKIRSEFRQTRKILKKRKLRKENVIKKFITYNLVSDPKSAYEYIVTSKSDIYHLRVKALNEKVEKYDILRIVYQIAKHRGYFQFTDEVDENNADEMDKSKTNFLKVLKLTHTEINKNNFTPAEYLLSLNSKQKRNRKGKYLNIIHRNDLRNELFRILNRQSEFYPEITNEFIDEICSESGFIFGQVHWSEKMDIEKLSGKCRLETEEYKYPEKTILGYEYKFWEKTKKYVLKKKKKRIESSIIDEFQIIDYKVWKEILDEIFLGKKFDSSEIISKILGSNKGYTIYNKETKREVKKIDESLLEFKELRKLFELNEFLRDANIFTMDNLDKILSLYTLYKTEQKLSQEFAKLPCLKGKNVEINMLSKHSTHGWNGFTRYSKIVLQKLNSHFRQGKNWQEAMEASGYKDKEFSITVAEITNPVVLKIHNKTIKLVNSLIRKYGKPTYINIEVARDFANSAKSKKRLREENISRSNRKKTLEKNFVKIFGENNLNVRNFEKYKYWVEQGERSIYNYEKVIEANRLLEEGYCQIDHIIPRSVSFDDSLNNKILILTSENQNKGSKMPIEYIGTENWDEYENQVRSRFSGTIPDIKLRNLLYKGNKDDYQKNFLSRNLNDTRFISKLVISYLKSRKFLSQLPEIFKGNEVRVRSTNGTLTAYIRRHLLYDVGYKKERSDYRHHAVDAVIISISNTSMYNSVGNYFRLRENYLSTKTPPKFPIPWNNFSFDIINRIFGNKSYLPDEDLYKDCKNVLCNNSFVVCLGDHSVNKSMHATKYERVNYLKAAVEIFDNKSSKLYARAENSEMLRVDIWKTHEGKYAVVPVYRTDFSKYRKVDYQNSPDYPRMYIPKKNGKYIDTNLDHFIMSLYANDFVVIKYNGKINENDLANIVENRFKKNELIFGYSMYCNSAKTSNIYIRPWNMVPSHTEKSKNQNEKDKSVLNKKLYYLSKITDIKKCNISFDGQITFVKKNKINGFSKYRHN